MNVSLTQLEAKTSHIVPAIQGSAFIQKKKKETESSKKKSALQNKYK
jgi:hypothetical protein